MHQKKIKLTHRQCLASLAPPSSIHHARPLSLSLSPRAISSFCLFFPPLFPLCLPPSLTAELHFTDFCEGKPFYLRGFLATVKYMTV